MDWDDLRYVLAVARERTLSRAAEKLGATHTTVGRRLRTIEQAMGARLFDQTPDGYVTTHAGRAVVESAERVEAELHSLEARVLGEDAQLEGVLRVTTLAMLLRRYHRGFSSFIERYPKVEFSLSTQDAELSLSRREADVALRMTNTPPEQLVGRKVGRVEFAVYAAKSLVERVGEGAPLSAFPWVNWDPRLGMRWLDEWLARNAPGARVSVRIDVSSDSVYDVVAAGLGAHLLSTIDGERDPSLVRIAPVDPSYSRDLWLLTLNELRSTSRVRAFMDHMEAHVRSLA